MDTDEMIRALREYADFHHEGDVWWRTLTGAADKLEELDERVAIMQESKTGQWEKAEYNGFLVCSRCHNAFIEKEWLKDGKWHYCPNCGSFLTIGEAEKIDI